MSLGYGYESATGELAGKGKRGRSSSYYQSMSLTEIAEYLQQKDSQLEQGIRNSIDAFGTLMGQVNELASQT